MKYNAVVIHHEWLEQARLLFASEEEVGKAILALLDYALYDKKYRGESKQVKAFILSVTKMVISQRKRYASIAEKRDLINIKTKIKTNINTSKKDEEERKIYFYDLLKLICD